jgi:hypothetical protein
VEGQARLNRSSNKDHQCAASHYVGDNVLIAAAGGHGVAEPGLTRDIKADGRFEGATNRSAHGRRASGSRARLQNSSL